MVQSPASFDADSRNACVATPLDDYELIDFGAGRKLERWGEYMVEYPDRLATGKRADKHWFADWFMWMMSVRRATGNRRAVV